jgi:hypothetical protein
MNTAVIDKVVEQLKALPNDLQWRVYEYTRTLAAFSRGVSSLRLLRFAGLFSVSETELMRKTIEEGCERIDSNEW